MTKGITTDYNFVNTTSPETAQGIVDANYGKGTAVEFWEAILWVFLILSVGTGLLKLLCWLLSLLDREPQTTSLGASTLPCTSRNPKAPLVIEKQPKLPAPELMAEVENNLRIASEPWTGELIPYHTSVWYAKQFEVYQLPTNLRDDLNQVYDMIGLVNQLAWLSAEFGRRSQNIDETHRRTRTSIAEGLHRIKQNVG